ncbi:TIGR02680 family protein [Streptomyces sp. YIM 98790]|uniref:TIGR02680 family protein n=1 Tax=Streptomyces sp. YIM 98790 TaxID=2689077 RepID=UPI00140A4BA3|nr:TIGR02680 family protein [Streptomyces sp. YIM 98790]
MTVIKLADRTRNAAAGPHGHVPGADRWRPTRAGILNVWRYYDEVFTFHQGRLLLRGPNGTGKSKALELLLPFLLDASLRPNRLSTFGGSERTMHWNLMGEGASGRTRVGYVWLEFTRGEAGHSQWFCCGARLQATVHTTSVTADFFTTGRRISHCAAPEQPDGPGSLHLVDAGGRPVSRRELRDALSEGRGALFPSAAEYRAAVRHTLFPGMTEQRYDALLTALLQLRTPKLSQRLDPALLSTLLSRALPPLGEAEIGELAEGFERLDRQRERLRKLDQEVAAAETLAARQRTYVQRVLRAAAGRLISATTDLDNVTREARESEQKLESVLAERAEAGQDRDRANARGLELEAAIDGLLDSEIYRRGSELDDLRRRADRAERAAGAARDRADSLAAVAEQDAQRRTEAAERAGHAGRQHDQARAEVRLAARPAAMESVAEELDRLLGVAVDPTRGAGGSEEERPEQAARQLLHGAVNSRRDQVARVRRAGERHERAVDARTAAETALEEHRAQLAEAVTSQAAAARAHEQALDTLAGELRQWAGRCTELRITDPAALSDRAASRDAVQAIVEPAARDADRRITEERTTVAAARTAAAERRGGLTAELDHLAEAADLPPRAPHTRTADRTAREGAPLWRLVSFCDDVPAAVQAGVEAALEAAGLLDAWVGPHTGFRVSGHDTFAEADLAHPVHGPSLLDILRPEPESPVPVERIRRILSGIAYGPTLPAPTLPAAPVAAVSADGHWRLAGFTGSWAKAESAHIGAAARERARLRRIDELTRELEEATAAVAALDDRLHTLDERRRRLDLELRSRPSHEPLDSARQVLERAEARTAAREDAVRAAVTRLDRCESDVRQTLRALTALAAEQGLPAEPRGLDAVLQAVTTFQDTVGAWLHARTRWTAARRAAAVAREQAERSARTAGDSAGDADRARAEATALAARRAAVESAIGEDYRETARRIGDLRRERDRTRKEAAALDAGLLRLADRIATLRASMTAEVRRREEAVGERNTAAARFRHLCGLGLAEDAGLPLSLSAQDGTRATLEASRTVAARWPSLPHAPHNLGDAYTRLADAVHSSRQDLGERADLDLEADEDVQIFTATLDGIRVGAAQLLTTLIADRDRSAEDITAAERDLFDRTLTGDTRRHLADRIRQANALVDRMNKHLDEVRTASNVAVRLDWDVDPELPPGTRTARDLLLKDPRHLTETDHRALHDFFRARIDEARARDTATGWEDQLAEVLDYTRWHRFTVRLHRDDEHGWQPLTRKLHGALSGGEKAIALHLPLFAAVAAYYEAVPRAPRLILLDEVFVGVDSANRGQVFALLSALDLDLALTSDHEWCTYRELPGIAIHQLITEDAGSGGDDAVTSARFTWTGTRLHPENTAP